MSGGGIRGGGPTELLSESGSSVGLEEAGEGLLGVLSLMESSLEELESSLEE